jgi:hypothetical protein
MKSVLLAVLLALSMPAYGQRDFAYRTGNQLLSSLQDWSKPQPANTVDAAAGAGYVLGIADALNGNPRQGGARFCLAKNVTAVQLTEAVRAFLQKNPQHHHRAAADSVILALAEAFPCR